MVSFNNLFCLTALVSICSAHSDHAHLHRRSHLQGRQFSNGTETTILPIGTGTVVAPPAEYTSTVTQIAIKLVTVTYTLGDGRVKTTTITKSEESTQTIAHVRSTVNVEPIIETPAPASAVSEAPVSSPVKPKSTSTATLVVTITSGETTVTVPPDIASTSTAACSVETVFVPQYITLYSTVTIAAAPSIIHSSIIPPYSNHTSTDTNTISYDSTSTTIVSVYTTVVVYPTPA